MSDRAHLVQFNFISMPGTSCMFKDTTYYDKLRMQTLFPAVTIFLLLVPGMYTIVSGMLCHGGWKYHPKHTPVINRSAASRCLACGVSSSGPNGR